MERNSLNRRLKSLRQRKEKPEKVEKGEKDPASVPAPQQNEQDESNDKATSSVNPVDPSTTTIANGKTSLEKKRPHSNNLSTRFFQRLQRGEYQKTDDEIVKIPQSDRLKKAQEFHAQQFQVDELQKKLAEEGKPDVPKALIREALLSNYAACDTKKARELINVRLKSDEGWIARYDANVALVGAENRQAVTCYLDSLLFAMFVRMDAYECMLQPNQNHSPEEKKLADLLRLWVNMVRLGMLIHVDQTAHLLDALEGIGWHVAKEIVQQDVQEVFTIITEALGLPLLTLEVNLFHEGRKDVDDHKLVHERLLNLPVPDISEIPEGKDLKLEDCLEEYFNTRVEVKRDNPEKETLYDDSRRILDENDRNAAECSSPTAMDEPAPLPSFSHRSTMTSQGGADEDTGPSPSEVSVRPIMTRPRTGSTIQRFVVDNNQKITGSVDNPGILANLKQSGTTIIKAITIPAWQFYRLIPFAQRRRNTGPSSDSEIINSLQERPVVGICLKRYFFDGDTKTIKKRMTHLDIPDSMSLPHIMATDDEVEGEFSQKYKLVLQSVVCHRGETPNSGHYIAFARIDPKLLTENRRQSNDPPPDYEEAQWVKFDDLAQDSGGRVACIDDIRQSLREEAPYVLFYQIVPIVDCPRSSMDNGSNTEPPSYVDSTTNHDDATTGSGSGNSETDGIVPMVSRQTSGYFDISTAGPQSSGPSVRFSLDQPGSRTSIIEDAPNGFVSTDSVNITLLESTNIQIVTPGTASGGVTPSILTPGSESPAHKFRAGVTKIISRSRPESQGEGSSHRVAAMLKMVRSSSKEVIHTDHAIESTQSSPTKENALADIHLPPEKKDWAHGHDKKDKKSKGKKKDEAKLAVNEKGKAVPDRECIVM